MELWYSFIVMTLSHLLAIKGDPRQKIISTPDKPTRVFVGENVSLTWRFYKPPHLTLVEVVFGLWKSTGILDPKLVAVSGSSGIPLVRPGYESSVGWAGNLTSSLAVFVLYDVQPKDGNVEFGIQVEFGLAYNPLTDVVRLQVEAKPITDPPKITYVSIPPLLRIGQNLNLSCTANSLTLLNVTWYKRGKVASKRGNGTSKAVLRLHNITDEDWGECVCIAKDVFGEDREAVFLKILPASPTILNTNKIANFASWVLRWSAVYSEGRLVNEYTVRYRVVHVTKKHVTDDGSWVLQNITGVEYRADLAADCRYMFAVTAWNRWGESSLEDDKVFVMSTNFTAGITGITLKPTDVLQTGSETLMSPTSSSNRKDMREDDIMLATLITFASFCFLAGLGYLARKKITGKREKSKTGITGITLKSTNVLQTRKNVVEGRIGQQGSIGISGMAFTSEVSLASESPAEQAAERRSVMVSGSPMSIPESSLTANKPPSPVINTRDYYNQLKPGEHFPLTSFRPELNPNTPRIMDNKQSSSQTLDPDRGGEGSHQDIEIPMSVIKPGTFEEENQVAMEMNTNAASNETANRGINRETKTNSVRNIVGTDAYQQTNSSDGYLQPVDGEKFQDKRRNSPRLCDRKAQNLQPRPQPKPRLKILGRRETEKIQRNNPAFSRTSLSLEFTDLRANDQLNETTNSQHCACGKPFVQSNPNSSRLRTFPGSRMHGYQNDSFSMTSCQNSTNQGSPLQSLGNHESPYTSVQSNINWELPPGQLTLFERIGGGSFGQVWKGAARDLIGAKGWTVVAVKMLKDGSSQSELRDLMSELDLLKKLKPHPNVIRLMGCVTKDVVRCQGKREFRPPLVLLEFVPYGDLLGYLKKSKGEIDDYYNLRKEEAPRKISRQQLYQFARDIARGMEFISTHQFIHRDLAARNVLVGEGMRCKITDFGMARDLGKAEIYVRRSNGLMPVKWMAVESLVQQIFTTESDVWSYGIVLYEIFTLGGCPYDGMAGEEVLSFVASGGRMQRTSAITKDLYKLMLQCWQEDPFKRPKFSTIASWMEMLGNP